LPSTTLGFSGSEIVALVQTYTGNASSDFQSYVSSILPLAEFRFCKLHDWNFLYKKDLRLTVATGTMDYQLSPTTLTDALGSGYTMAADDVKSIFSIANQIYLRKTSLDEIRRMDPGESDGNDGAKINYWCESGDNQITIYPPIFADTELRIDGKVTPTALLTLSNYPTIPFKYQESFIKYVIAMSLERENDDRSQQAMANALQAAKMDIQNDLASLGSTDEPRMRDLREQRLDGFSATIDPLNMRYNPYS
jgi:hypothetical protein